MGSQYRKRTLPFSKINMKRHGDLFEKIIELDNIYLAYRKARKGKSWQNTISRFDEVLNKEILVTGYKIKDSHQKKGTQYLTIHFELEGKQHITFTGSIVLMNQLKKYESHLPFLTTIKKINKYYSFS